MTTLANVSALDPAAILALIQNLGPAGVVGGLLFWLLTKRDAVIESLTEQLRASQEARIAAAERLATVATELNGTIGRLISAVDRVVDTTSEVGELVRVQNAVQQRERERERGT